jgi:hypothetical protein
MNKFFGYTSVCFMLWLPVRGPAQSDPVAKAAGCLHDKTGGKLSVHIEERTRWEEKDGVSFGKAVNQQDMLSRIRIGLRYQPLSWLTVSAMGQDARAPFYGAPAPNSMRDSMDLQEAFVTFASKASPFSFSTGRQMLNYGETRVIGVPQWSNTSRTYDYGRFEFARKNITLDALMVSPVIVQPNSFNTPELGNRYWGTYDIFTNAWHKFSVDTYALRHSENVIGGWTSAGTLGTNTFGSRVYGPLPGHIALSLEAIGQTGHSGLLNQRAYAWFAGASRPFRMFTLPLSTSVEYKVASGSHAGEKHSETFDQLTPANHDKFGNQDLFGWRNLKTFKSLETLSLSKSVAFNAMYTDETLFNATDALYASSGSKIASSATGAAGKRVGQELDGFLTLKWGQNNFQLGVSHFFKGQFIKGTTPDINPRYFYFSQEYIIK